MKYPALDQSKVKLIPFPADQYYTEPTTKRQIVLHHTASGPGIDGDVAWWLQDPSRVATSKLIGRDGTIYSCFSSGSWAHHLGTRVANNRDLNRCSIGIEIDAWGPLVFLEGAYRSYTGDKVGEQDVVTYATAFKTLPRSAYFDKHGVSGKGAYSYHSYTDSQILSVAQLLEHWGELYNIPLNYNEDMWRLNPKALAGQPGIWTHVSYLEEKADCHPQVELIAMLKNLTP